MALDVDTVQQQPRKLLKSVNKISREAPKEQVHKIRTRARRLEALIDAFGLGSRKNEKNLLKAIKQVRSKAGDVRDTDVLTSFVLTLPLADEKECSIKVLQYLFTKRQKYARKLKRAAKANKRELKRRINKHSRLLNRELDAPDTEHSWSAQAAAAALSLEGELRNWAKLNRTNLHPFRLKVKQLRYVLQMAKESKGEFIDALGQVKDSIGEWHDWNELAVISQGLIQHDGCKLLKGIHATVQDRFEHAMESANQMRKQHLSAPERGTVSSKSQLVAVVSASDLAA